MELQIRKELSGLSLWDGPNKRAVIVPMRPARWNGGARWLVDAIRLDRARYVRTFADTRCLAFANA
jgi:hypothetical protein